MGAQAVALDFELLWVPHVVLSILCLHPSLANTL